MLAPVFPQLQSLVENIARFTVTETERLEAMMGVPTLLRMLNQLTGFVVLERLTDNHNAHMCGKQPRAKKA